MKTPQTFEFQAPIVIIPKHGIKVADEDILYNWTDNNIITFSSSGKPLYVAKEMHPLILEALIGTCSKSKSFVIDFVTSTNI